MLISHIQLIAIDRCTKFLVMAISEPGKGKKKQRWLHISIPGYGTSFGAQCFLPDPSVTSGITSPPVHLYHCDL